MYNKVVIRYYFMQKVFATLVGVTYGRALQWDFARVPINEIDKIDEKEFEVDIDPLVEDLDVNIDPSTYNLLRAEDWKYDLVSPLSKKETQIRLTNNLPKPIDLVWIDFNGKPVVYQNNIQPGATIAQHTYVGHVWRVRDSYSQDALWYFEGVAMPNEELVINEFDNVKRMN